MARVEIERQISFFSFGFACVSEVRHIYLGKLTVFPGFLLGLEDLEKWEGIFQSWNFEQTGKVWGNHTKYWKTRGISEKCYF